jgi:hypothetical protein
VATYNLIDPAKQIQNGVAVGWAPQAKSTQGAYLKTDRIEAVPAGDGTLTNINGRFKVGGSTGWERPGSNLT